MGVRKYRSFKEIDRDLRVLKLKKEIDWVCLKGDVDRVKSGFVFTNIIREGIHLLGTSLLANRGGFFNLAIGYLVKRILLK